MRFLAKYERKHITKEGIEITFNVPHSYFGSIEQIENKEYVLELTNPSNKRSLNQNSMLWELIGEICKVEDGNQSGKEDKYLQLLEMTGVKTTILSMPKEAVDDFKALVRHIRVLDTYLDGEQEKATVEVFYGSSTFNTKQMSKLIDTAIWYASQIGIETDYYKQLLEE